MSAILSPPIVFQGLTAQGLPLIGGLLYSYIAGTSTPQATYTDSTMGTPNTNPVVLNASGQAPVWLDPTLTYKFILKDAAGNTLSMADQVHGYLTAAVLGSLLVSLIPGVTNTYNLGSSSFTWANGYFGTAVYVAGVPVASYPITAAETAAGFTTSTLSMQYPYGNMLRYGIVPNDAGSAASNTTIAKALFDPTITNGPSGQFFFPNTSGADVYYFNGVIPIRDGVRIDLQECTLNFSGTAAAPTDTNSGFLFALRDFEVKNGSIVVSWATSTATSTGSAIKLGARANESSYFTVYDSTQATPLGNCRISNVRINSTITGSGGGAGSGASAIAMTGGLQGVVLENIYINGNATLPLGIVYEFGWATDGGGVTNLRQTSHAHNIRCTNINVQNMDNSNTSSCGLQFTGAYSVSVDGLYVTGCSNGFLAIPGEAMYWRPWVGVDDTGAKHNIKVQNVVVSNFLNSGISVDGTYTRAANSSYTQPAWIASTAYSNGGGAAFNSGQTVINGGNMYVCTTSGTSASSGGPTGTGTGIVDGTVHWSYVSLTANTDLLDCIIDNYAISSGGTTGNGIVCNVGKATIGLGTVTGCRSGIVIEEECTRFSIDQADLLNNNNQGINGSFTASAIWSPARLKKGSVRNCYIAGNSQSGAGTFGGMSIQNYDSMIVENNRFGYEAAYDFVAETTQAQAILIALTTNCSNLMARNNRVNVVSGNAYSNINNTNAFGNTIEFPTGVTTNTGLWDGVDESWTPVLTCATPGDLAVTGGTSVGGFIKRDNRVDYWYRIEPATFTHTTSSGNVAVNGLPYPAVTLTSLLQAGPVAFSGMTKAGYGQLVGFVPTGGSSIAFEVSGTGVALANLAITDLPSGGSVILRGSGTYFTS